MHFHLFDPAPFTVKELKVNNNIFIRQQLFTDDIAREFYGTEPLFICDIRSADKEIMNNTEIEAQVKIDMDRQMRWHNLMGSRASELKFRLPWGGGTTQYLSGRIFLPIWGPITTTETRLITDGGMREYDNLKYMEQMFYFNTVTRVTRFPHDITKEGIDYCYDCAAEIHVLKEFLKKRGDKALSGNSALMKSEVETMISDISSYCSKTRSLKQGNLDPAERSKTMQKYQFIDGMPAYELAKIQMAAKEEAMVPIKMYDAESSFGKKMMLKMGFEEGKGLGRNLEGITTTLLVEENPQMR